ncbi:hypothetical protein BDZ89DRAFT_902557, partial [Hymenopellis radicata]
RPQIGGQRITWEYLCSLTPEECRYRFRYVTYEIRELADRMQIPDPFPTANGCLFPQIEALGLLLARYKSPADEFDIPTQYCRSQSGNSQLVNELNIWIERNWS